MSAVKAGKRILLANKEALVMSGSYFIDAVEKYGVSYFLSIVNTVLSFSLHHALKPI
ncbi:hypothetical protein O9992_04535 [Vibrio lentus]|nr:hypothetical protein [Vibrio lentus]